VAARQPRWPTAARKSRSGRQRAEPRAVGPPSSKCFQLALGLDVALQAAQRHHVEGGGVFYREGGAPSWATASSQGSAACGACRCSSSMTASLKQPLPSLHRAGCWPANVPAAAQRAELERLPALRRPCASTCAAESLTGACCGLAGVLGAGARSAARWGWRWSGFQGGGAESSQHEVLGAATA